MLDAHAHADALPSPNEASAAHPHAAHAAASLQLPEASSSLDNVRPRPARVGHRFFHGCATLFRLVAIGVTLTVYLVLAPYGYATFAMVRGRPAEPQLRARRLNLVLHRAFRLMHGWLSLTRLVRLHAPSDATHQIPHGPCVLVANHPTLFDVTAIIATFGGMCTVVKPQLFRAWWLRSLMRGAQHIEGAKTPVQAAKIIEAAVSRLCHGHRVLIFPEGTRSPESGISAFGRTAFEIACRANVALVPILVRCDPPYLSKTTPVYRPPHPTATLSLKVLPAIEPATFGHDSRAMQRAVQRLYREQLDGEQSPVRAV